MEKSMEERRMTCIVCPVGCQILVMRDGEDVTVKDYGCKRGITYGKQEFLRPMRTVTSSIRVNGGAGPLCPVKTRGQVPKDSIPQVLEAIRTLTGDAPITIGDVLLGDVAGTGVDLVATSSVNKA